MSQAKGASREPCEVGICLDLASLEARPWLCFPEVSSSLSVLTAQISCAPSAVGTWLPVLAAWDLAQRDLARRCPYTREVRASRHSGICTVTWQEVALPSKAGPLLSSPPSVPRGRPSSHISLLTNRTLICCQQPCAQPPGLI